MDHNSYKLKHYSVKPMAHKITAYINGHEVFIILHALYLTWEIYP